MATRDDQEGRTPLDTPVATGTCLLAIGVTALYWAGRNIDPLTMSPAAFGHQPWRLFTSALVHAHFKSSGFAGVFHILFNVSWTHRFGSALETRYGSLRTLLLFAALAAGASAAEFAIFEGGIGLSGVVYGLWGYLFAATKATSDFDDLVDRRVHIGFVAWFFFCIATTYFHVLAVANVAHGMGAVLGALAGLAFTSRTAQRRWGARALGAVVFASTFACATVLRPIVNVDGYARETASAAFDLMETDPARAAELYAKAFAKEPKNPNYCYNLGVALARSGHREEAAPLFAKACELARGTDPRYCR
jgi:membrane associated rhomboid family serine protease